MKIYVSGPMTGLPEHNFPAFDAESERLRALGHTVTNPAEINPIGCGLTWTQCLKNDIRALMDCDTIVLLPGWKKSKGAKLERYIGRALGYRFFNAGDIGNRWRV